MPTRPQGSLRFRKPSLQSKITAVSAHTAVIPPPSRPLCVHRQDLLPERQYKFRIRAENIYGISEPSAESEDVTVGLADDNGEDTSAKRAQAA